MDGIALDLAAQVGEVGHPAVLGIQIVGDVRQSAVRRLRRRVGAVRRRRADDPGVGAQEAVDLGHRVGDAVEEDDVLGRDPRAWAPVDVLGQRLPGFHEALGGAVAPGVLDLDHLVDDVADPGHDLLALGYGVADVLPGDVHAVLAHDLAELDDLADGVRKL